MDNQTAVSYVNRMGGTHSFPLMQEACLLWKWCLERGITLSAEYLPGLENTVADQESRLIQTSAEWKLHPETFSLVQQVLGPCQVDLFATRLNHQMAKYVSWRPDPYAMGTDAFQLCWLNLMGYAFPPFSLIGRCIQKTQQEGSTIVLITPLWRTQAWFPALLESAVACPLLLPKRQDLLMDPLNQPHPIASQGKLQLVAWKISGEGTRQQEFHRGLQTYSSLVGAKGLTQHMNQDGDGGFAGVTQGRWIPFHVQSTPS